MRGDAIRSYGLFGANDKPPDSLHIATIADTLGCTDPADIGRALVRITGLSPRTFSEPLSGAHRAVPRPGPPCRGGHGNRERLVVPWTAQPMNLRIGEASHWAAMPKSVTRAAVKLHIAQPMFLLISGFVRPLCFVLGVATWPPAGVQG